MVSENQVHSRDLCNAYNDVVNEINTVYADSDVQQALHQAIAALETLGRKCEITKQTRRIDEANAAITAATARIAKLTGGTDAE